MKEILYLAFHVGYSVVLFLLAIVCAGIELFFGAIAAGTGYVADLAEAGAIALLKRSGFG